MSCPSCGNDLKTEWRFCPFCGRKKQDGFFTKFRREVERVQKNMETGTFGEPEMKPMGQGFTIKISTGSGMEPRVEVKTLGDVKEQEIARQLQNMGVKVNYNKAPVARKHMKMPKETEEPKTRVVRMGKGMKVEIELPGVEGKNIDVQEFESSVEIRALGRQKAFFKIINKPEKTSVVGREFKNSNLVLEIA
ncbi:MAG: zinc ribbon domain-containing protein [Candidatus Aenigmatarchaeota archaeon]